MLTDVRGTELWLHACQRQRGEPVQTTTELLPLPIVHVPLQQHGHNQCEMHVSRGDWPQGISTLAMPVRALGTSAGQLV